MTDTPLLTIEEANYIRKKQGEYFGYPSCCVKSFITFVNGKGKRYPIQNKNSHPEGFVPCWKHAKLLDKKKITMRDLIQNRVCSLTFAFDDFMNTENYRNGYQLAIKDKEVFHKWIQEKKKQIK
jgi:hypothetical protein